MIRSCSRWILCPLLIAFTGCAGPASPRFDLLIRNGRVVDGSGNPWFHADVGVRGARIAGIGDLSQARAALVIDATDLVVAPGFIDVHTHADDGLYDRPLAENFARNGVTTIVTGNCGYSESDLGLYFRRLRDQGVAINVASLIGHNTVLRAVKGNRAGALTEDQSRQAHARIEQAMRDGAVGMSTGLIYTPGKYSDTEEIIALQKTAARHGGIYATHMRSESTGIVEAIDEALRVGREAGCRVQISHFKLPTDVSRTLGGARTTLGQVAEARSAGQEVWLDQYPYTASSTSLSVMLPDWVLAGGYDEARKLLRNPSQRAKVLADMAHHHERRRARRDLSFAVIASCDSHPQYAGLDLVRVTQIEKFARQSDKHIEPDQVDPDALPTVSMQDQYQMVIDLYLAGGASCVYHTMSEEDVQTIMRDPSVAICSDSGVRSFGEGMPHPRGYGANARVLGHYVRRQGVLELEDAVRKMTSMPATAFRFTDRGRLRKGAFADLTIFDPERVQDRATFVRPHQYPDGIEHVIVNGQPILMYGRMTGVRSGRPLYGPGALTAKP